MDTASPWFNLLLALLLLLLPSPVLTLFDRLRARKPPTPDEQEAGAQLVYEVWARGQVAPSDPYPPWRDMADRGKTVFRDIWRAARGLSLLLCLLFCVGACGNARQNAAARSLATSIEGNAADLAAFGRWDQERQVKIRTRCREQNVGGKECTRRLKAYMETRDALLALLRKQILTIEAATAMLARSPEAATDGGVM